MKYSGWIKKFIETNKDTLDLPNSTFILDLKEREDFLYAQLESYPNLSFRNSDTYKEVNIDDYENEISGIKIMRKQPPSPLDILYTKYIDETLPGIITNIKTDNMTEFENFKKELSNRVVEFEYTKKDGTVRKAKGTTKSDVIPENMQPKGVERNYSEDNVRYYDIDKEGWRSFNKNNFVSFVK